VNRTNWRQSLLIIQLATLVACASSGGNGGTISAQLAPTAPVDQAEAGASAAKASAALSIEFESRSIKAGDSLVVYLVNRGPETFRQHFGEQTMDCGGGNPYEVLLVREGAVAATEWESAHPPSDPSAPCLAVILPARDVVLAPGEKLLIARGGAALFKRDSQQITPGRYRLVTMTAQGLVEGEFEIIAD
jgi:hypothetical protein